jgi:hypothetical protein
MKEIRLPIPVKLFVGILSPEPALFGSCSDIVCREYGPVDYQSEIVPWTNSDFYQEEMGPGILRPGGPRRSVIDKTQYHQDRKKPRRSGREPHATQDQP